MTEYKSTDGGRYIDFTGRTDMLYNFYTKEVVIVRLPTAKESRDLDTGSIDREEMGVIQLENEDNDNSKMNNEAPYGQDSLQSVEDFVVVSSIPAKDFIEFANAIGSYVGK